MSPPTPNLEFAFSPMRNPNANQWNIGGVGSSGIGHVYFMYISCIFHVVCASFSTLVTQKLADAKAVFSGIWALELTCCMEALPFMQAVDTTKARNLSLCVIQMGAVI